MLVLYSWKIHDPSNNHPSEHIGKLSIQLFIKFCMHLCNDTACNKQEMTAKFPLAVWAKCKVRKRRRWWHLLHDRSIEVLGRGNLVLYMFPWPEMSGSCDYQTFVKAATVPLTEGDHCCHPGCSLHPASGHYCWFDLGLVLSVETSTTRLNQMRPWFRSHRLDRAHTVIRCLGLETDHLALRQWLRGQLER